MSSIYLYDIMYFLSTDLQAEDSAMWKAGGDRLKIGNATPAPGNVIPTTGPGNATPAPGNVIPTTGPGNATPAPGNVIPTTGPGNATPTTGNTTPTTGNAAFASGSTTPTSSPSLLAADRSALADRSPSSAPDRSPLAALSPPTPMRMDSDISSDSNLVYTDCEEQFPDEANNISDCDEDDDDDYYDDNVDFDPLHLIEDECSESSRSNSRTSDVSIPVEL
jgi:hypothetical protein